MRDFWFPRALTVNLLLAATMHGMRPVVSYRALALDAGPTGIGVIVATYAILAFLIAVPAGRWVDRHGEPLFIVAGTALVAVVGVILAISTSLPVLALGMACLGAGQVITAVALQSLIANGGSADGRDGRFGVQTVVTSFGQLVGPALAGFIVAASLPPGRPTTGVLPLQATDGVFWLGAIVGVATCLVAVTLWRRPPREHARLNASQPADTANDTIRIAFARVLRVPSMPQAMLASLAVLSTIDIVVAYLPVYGVAYGIPVATVGLLLAVRAAASMVSRAFMLPLRRVLGRRRLLLFSIVAPALMLLVLPLAGSATTPLFLVMAMVGFGLGLGQPLTMSWVATRAPFDIRATAIGVRLSANRLGQVAVPATVGVVAGAAGLTAIFWSLSAMLAATALVVMTAPFDAPVTNDAEVIPP